jgi:hypothetical protein
MTKRLLRAGEDAGSTTDTSHGNSKRCARITVIVTPLYWPVH